MQYIVNNFEEERKKDIEEFGLQLKKMRIMLKEIKNKKKVVSKNSINKEFPDPNKQFIWGFTDEEKRKECQYINDEIKKDILHHKQNSKPKVSYNAQQYYK